MKKLLINTAIAALATGSAFAADLPSHKAPYIAPPPPPMWTGFYAGLNAGYSFGMNNSVTTTVGAAQDGLAALLPGLLIPGSSALANAGVANITRNGFIGGAQVGYNYQWGSSYVIGIEADLQGAGIRGSGGNGGFAQDGFALGGGALSVTRTSAGFNDINAGIDWMGTVRGRVGYLFTPTMLLYGTGGLAYGGTYANTTNSLNHIVNVGILPPLANITATFPTVAGVGRQSDTLLGWTAGAGFEWMLSPGWSLKAEALYYDLGTVSFGSTGVAAVSPINVALLGGAVNILGGSLLTNVPTTRIQYDGVMARAGVNYHFNFGGGAAPVMAGY
ncbi:MAG: outer-membrane immunogenic protein precursor [Methylocystis sp.]|nr:MAG: outer-membrane immunogenic protein precursor [Methylocystis sp.]